MSTDVSPRKEANDLCTAAEMEGVLPPQSQITRLFNYKVEQSSG